MHIFFSGIGGTGIGPLALIALQAGYSVSGSDTQDSQYIQYLRKKGITNIEIGQSRDSLSKLHDKQPIDWLVYSSAVPKNSPEIAFCREQSIEHTKRDVLLNQILSDKRLKLIAVAGTHGKSTATAMVVWLFHALKKPVSYSVGAKIPFGDMGNFDDQSDFFVYECDEFDRNFLAFEPAIGLITGVSWDHHEIFPTREEYQLAFRDFISQSRKTYIWQDDATYLGLPNSDKSVAVTDPSLARAVDLKGLYNRLDAWLAIEVVHDALGASKESLVKHIASFPGLQRRMEELAPNLYSDYAHTPEKITGAMSVALEIAEEQNKNVIVLYEPLTNRRQHYMLTEYRGVFDGATRVYWLPSYLAREDSSQRIIQPEELISHLDDPTIANPAVRDGELETIIRSHLKNGDMVVAMNGGGGDSLDEWLRMRFTQDSA